MNITQVFLSQIYIEANIKSHFVSSGIWWIWSDQQNLNTVLLVSYLLPSRGKYRNCWVQGEKACRMGFIPTSKTAETRLCFCFFKSIFRIVWSTKTRPCLLSEMNKDTSTQQGAVGYFRKTVLIFCYKLQRFYTVYHILCNYYTMGWKDV